MRCSWWSTGNFLFFPAILLLCLDALRLSNRIILASAGPMCGCASHFDVLMDFFNATGGPTWTIRSGWGASLASPCTTSSWYGVTCVDGNITSLDLSGNNLKGTLPPSLGNLSQLQFLNLYINRISGTLPASYGQRLVSIQQISMHSNQFAGSLPDSWGALPRLTYLNLDFNRLNGTLPGEPWSTSSLLTSLSLNYNSLSGTLPESWGHSMSTMTYLQLTSNAVSGPLPFSWRLIPNLGGLWLGGNSLSGTISPNYTFASQTLVSLKIPNNQLTGTLPHSWWTIASLQLLDLSSNRFYGTLPSVWGSNWGLLTHLDVSFNRLSGELPPAWENVSSLAFLYVNDNCLEGTIPRSYSALPLVWQAPSSSVRSFNVCSTHIQWERLVVEVSQSLVVCTNSSSSSTAATWPHYCDCRSSSTTASSSATMSAPTPLTCLAIGLMTSALSRTTLTTVDAIAITAVNTSATTPVNLMVLAPAFTPSVPAVVSTSDSSTSKTIISIQAASVPRSLFLARTTPVAFAMNLTLRIPGAHIPTRWGMMGATFEEQVAGGVVLTWSSLHGVIDADDDDNRGGLWYAMVVMPPVGGWLGAGTPVMTDRTLTLTFDVDCDGEALLAVVVTVQAPGSLPSLAGEVKAAVGYSQIVSVIAGGASSGSSLGRVMATRSMVMCDADAAVGGGVVDLGLKLCDDEDGGNIHTGNVAARSAIVSNVVVIGIVSCLLIILSVVWSAVMPAASASSHRFLSATAVFVLPSSLLPVFTAVLPSTSAATTLLMGRLRSSSSCMSIDVVLIVLGILVSLTPSIALTALWAIKARGPFAPWTCTKTLLSSSSSKAPPRSNLEQQTTPYHRWRRATVFLLLRQWRWSTTPSLSKSCAAATSSSSLSSPTSNTTTTSSGMEPAWVVLLEHRLLWYAALDATFLVAVSVLAVVGGLDTKNTALCRGVTSVVIALLALQLLTVVIVRPHTTMFSFVQSSTTLFLTCASAVSQLAFIMTSATSTSGLWLAEMSAGCNLAVVGVTAVQMLLDFAALFAATRRRMDKLCFRQRDDDTDAPALYLSTTADDHERTSDDNFVNFVDNTFFNEISGDSRNAAMAEVIENNSITSASSRSKRGGNGGGVVELMLRSSSFLPHLLAEEEEEERELSSTSFASSSRGGGRRAASSPTTSTGGGVGSSSDRAGFGSTSFDSTSFLRRAEQKFWDAGGTAKPSEESALQPILFVSHVARVDSFDENSGDDDL